MIMMDIFKTHADIVTDYQSYIQSFLQIKDDSIRETVERELKNGKLWPDPLIQFNPSFQQHEGGFPSLIAQGVLHQEMEKIFAGYHLYQHQAEAIQLGVKRKDFVVTSGTGSGRSLTYLGTIFHHLLTHPKQASGIRAIIVYPMNALINSQTDVKKY